MMLSISKDLCQAKRKKRKDNPSLLALLGLVVNNLADSHRGVRLRAPPPAHTFWSFHLNPPSSCLCLPPLRPSLENEAWSNLARCAWLIGVSSSPLGLLFSMSTVLLKCFEWCAKWWKRGPGLGKAAPDRCRTYSESHARSWSSKRHQLLRVLWLLLFWQKEFCSWVLTLLLPSCTWIHAVLCCSLSGLSLSFIVPR